jgi:hypothetical protein
MFDTIWNKFPNSLVTMFDTIWNKFPNSFINEQRHKVI